MSPSEPLKVEILSQGHEVLLGEVPDTNAAWLALELDALGFSLYRHTVVGDTLLDIRDLITEISLRSDLCISTGGLGPTCDDLTSEAASLALETPLELDPIALDQIENWFQRSGRIMPETNRKQAFFPKGARRIDNAFGTAPGFSFVLNRCHFYCLPGVPREMKGMFTTAILPEIKDLSGEPVSVQMVFHTVGTGESSLQALLNAYPLPKEVELGFRTKGLENLVKLRYPSDFDISSTQKEIRALLSEWLFAITQPGDALTSLEGEALKGLGESGYSIFVSEPESLGRVSAALSGSSYFLGGLIPAPKPYPRGTLQEWAYRLSKENEADLVLVQSVHREASDLSPTLTIGLLTPEGFHEDQRRLSQDRNRNLETATSMSLNLIRTVFGSHQSIRKP